MNSENPGRTIGIAWYSSTQWALLKRVAADRADLDDTYAAWEMNALETERMIEETGQSVVRVPIDVTKISSWCRKRRIPNNSSSRAQYVAQSIQHNNGAGA
jgi:hypothetical protein